MDDDSLSVLLRRLVAERFPDGAPDRGPHLTAAAERLRLPDSPEWRVGVSSLSRWTSGAATPSSNGLLDLLDALSLAAPLRKGERELALRLLQAARVAARTAERH